MRLCRANRSHRRLVGWRVLRIGWCGNRSWPWHGSSPSRRGGYRSSRPVESLSADHEPVVFTELATENGSVVVGQVLPTPLAVRHRANGVPRTALFGLELLYALDDSHGEFLRFPLRGDFGSRVPVNPEAILSVGHTHSIHHGPAGVKASEAVGLRDRTEAGKRLRSNGYRSNRATVERLSPARSAASTRSTSAVSPASERLVR